MKNYVIKSIKSRPVLFALTTVLSILITFTVMDKYAERVYEKTAAEQQTTIFKLQQKVVSLESEISKVNTIIDEEFDKDTGKLIRKKTKQTSEKEKIKSKKSQTIQDIITKKNKSLFEKEWKKRERSHQLMIGYGMDNGFNRDVYLGYTQSFLFFELGVLGRTTTNFRTFGAGVLLGLRF